MSHILAAIATEAIAGVGGARLVRQALSQRSGPAPQSLLSVGKAAAEMARGALSVLSQRPRNLVVSKQLGASKQPEEFDELLFSAHPIPDETSDRAGRRVESWLRGAPVPVLVLLSGGATSLLASPRTGLSVQDLRIAGETLLGAGLCIKDVNMVRSELFRCAAGRLSRINAGPIEVLVLSDVLGGRLPTIGSGPFFYECEQNPQRVLEVASRAGLSDNLITWLKQSLAKTDPPTSKVQHHIIGDHGALLASAKLAAQQRGLAVYMIDEPFDGDVNEAAELILKMAVRLAAGSVWIGGGEPTVKLPPQAGSGGRNQHLALLVARGLHDLGSPAAGVSFVSIASDGDDGNTQSAGALVHSHSYAALVRPLEAIRSADSHRPLRQAEVLIDLPPTGTNLLDLWLLCRC